MNLLGPTLRRKRMAMLAPHVQGAVLDLGCGRADLYDSCRARIERYVGVERAEGHVQALRERFPQGEFVVRDIDREPLGVVGAFDCVVMAALIEHIFNQEFVMGQVARLLAPDGVVLLTTPTVLGNDIVHRAGSRVGLFARSAADDHIVIYNRVRFSTMAREVGLRVARYRRFQLGCNQFVILRRNNDADPRA